MFSTFSSSTTLSPPPSGWAVRLVAGTTAVGRALAQMVRALRHRAEVSRLLEMDDRGLKDIGLNRSEVIGALDGPLGADPSVRLRLDAVARRARARSREAAVRLLDRPAD